MARKPPVTTISAAGVSATQHDVAEFVISASVSGKTIAEAKDKLKAIVRSVEAELKRLTETGVEFIKKMNHVSTKKKWSYDRTIERNIPDGYVGRYSLSFQTKAMERVNDIFETLSSLDEVEVADPSFLVSNLDQFQADARKKAWLNATELFTEECQVMGIDPSDFKVASWQFYYDQSKAAQRPEFRSALRRMSSLANSADGEDEPIALHAGEANIKVFIEVTYTQKED